MHRSTARIAFTVLVLASALALAGCMDASLVQSGSGPASISIMDAPTTLGDLDLNVSGPAMGDINLSVTRDTDALVLEVPTGPDRRFDLVGFLNGDTTAFYQGLRTVGIGPEGVQVSLPMNLRSKIIIPDSGYGLVVRIDTLPTGDSSWNTFNIGTLNDAKDVDVDADGFVYIAGDEVARTPAIGTAATTLPVPVLGTGFTSIAVDSDREFLYTAGERRIIRSRLDGTNAVSPWVSAGDLFDYAADPFRDYIIQGIAVDEDGYIYVAQAPGVSKVDPNSRNVLAQFSVPGYAEGDDGLSDVMVRPDGVFALNVNSATPSTVIYRLQPTDLTVIDSYGRTTTSSAAADEVGEFYYPLRFLATLNKRITIGESDGNGFGHARLVSLDDLSGNGWQTYGTAASGAEVGAFRFYTYFVTAS